MALVAAIASLAAAQAASAASDLSVSITPSARSVAVGERVSYALSVANGGPDAADGAALSVTGLPATGLTADSSKAACQVDGSVSCEVGPLAPGEAASVTIAVRPAEPGPFTVRAALSGAASDPQPANDSVIQRTAVALRPGACMNPRGGSAGDDVFTGTIGGDRLVGGSGADRLSGGDGADCLFGKGGADRLSGGAGRDRISGGAGDDLLSGGTGDDSLSGGSGDDVMLAGPGDDLIRSNAKQSGTDLVDCGAGHDTAYLAPETFVNGCENVTVIPDGCDHQGSRVICPPAPSSGFSPAPGSGGGSTEGGGGAPRRRHCRHRHHRRYCPVGGVNQKLGARPPAPLPAGRP